MKRRFAAIFYDALLVFSMLFVMGIIYRLIFGVNSISRTSPYLIFYQIYLLAGAAFYFCFAWIKSGQTLGMKSWRIKVVNTDLSTISNKQALLRFAVAMLSWLGFGLGFIYAFTNSEKLTWHDKLSNTRLIEVAKK